MNAWWPPLWHVSPARGAWRTAVGSCCLLPRPVRGVAVVTPVLIWSRW